jgi:iron complex outermembrane receptor protein
VNVLDHRIAETHPERQFSGTLESRVESVDRSRAGVVGLDTAAGDFVFHLDGFKRASDDYHIPGYARTPELRESDPVEPEPKGRLPSSFTNSDNVTLGTSYVKDNGFLGAAISDYQTTYGVPNGEPDVSINAKRKRIDVRGGVRNTGSFIESAITRIGLANYDQAELEGVEASSLLSQKAIDSRVDFTHSEVASVRGTFGMQFQGSSFDVVGEEAFQPPTDTTTYSLYDLEEVLLSDTVTLQLGGRLDWNMVSTPGFDRELQNEITKNQDSFSQSAGLVWDFAPDYAAALSVAHTERAATGQELFADGPHLAVGAYEIGDPNLGLERSLGTDLTLRKKEGTIRGFVGGYYNRFWDYISANPTGATIDELPVYQFEPINADFIGFESQVAFFAVDRAGKEVSFDVQPDYVWARDRDNSEYLPRIPPLRVLVGANYFDKDLCRFRLEVQQVFAQDKVAQYETTTDGYTMLNLYVSKEVPWFGQNVELFGRGTNLLSEKVRNHVSYIKDVAPLPGASAMVGLRVKF